MITRIIGRDRETRSDANAQWLNLDGLAEVEVTSQEITHPIESALLLLPESATGWKASEPGPQILRILFDRPQRIKRLYLEFQEFTSARTQEFVLRWSSNGGASYREIVRQQYNFSPPGTTAEREHYSVDLDGVTRVELTIIPDISGGPARATLTQLRIGSNSATPNERSN
jgi:hypothetical protein